MDYAKPNVKVYTPNLVVRSKVVEISLYIGSMLLGLIFTNIEILGSNLYYLPMLSVLYFFDKKRIYTYIPIVMIGQAFHGMANLVDSFFLIAGYFVICEFASVLDIKKVNLSINLVFIELSLFLFIKNFFILNSINMTTSILIVAINFALTMTIKEGYKFVRFIDSTTPRKVSEYLSLVACLSVAVGLTSGLNQIGIIVFLIIIFAYSSDLILGILSATMLLAVSYFANIVMFDEFLLLLFVSFIVSLMNETNKVYSGVVSLAILVGYYSYQGIEMLVLTQVVIAIITFVMLPLQNIKEMIPNIKTERDLKLELNNFQVGVKKQIFNASVAFKGIDNFIEVEEPVKRKNANNIYNTICKGCYRETICFQKDSKIMIDIIDKLINTQFVEQKTNQILKRLSSTCINYDDLIQSIVSEKRIASVEDNCNKKVNQTKQIVSTQLREVSNMMEQISNDIGYDTDYLKIVSKDVRSALEAYKFEVVNIKIRESKKLKMSILLGNLDEAEIKGIVLPIISDATKGRMRLYKAKQMNSGFFQLDFAQDLGYVLDIGIMTKPKNSNSFSGDNILRLELKDNNFLLALSDGMGSGMQAHYESKEILRLLGKMVKSGVNIKSAIQTLNTIMSLRGTEQFSTLDITHIDMSSGNISMFKEGAAPTFLIQGKSVKKIESNSLPIGVVNSSKFNKQEFTVGNNDTIVMMSDGIYDQDPVGLEKLLMTIECNSAQHLAKYLLDNAVENKAIDDDMSVIVVRCVNKGS